MTFAHRVTHEVFNQVAPLTDYSLFDTDAALREAVQRSGAEWALPELSRIGAALGHAANFERGRLANAYPPVLHTHDAQGHRIDRIEFHPAWHELMQGVTARGFHSSPWAEPKPGAHVARAAGYLMQGQIEAGTLCPTTMTFGAIPVLQRDPRLAREWVPVLLHREYDARDLPIGKKHGGLIGMGMTEKQGGSDVRANTTRAERQPDGTWRITGHKWFFSAPQADAHLILAQSKAGLSCFFLPRWCPDGSRNAVAVQRLKDKLGNRSNASAEVEFDGAWAHLLGEEGRGVPTILEMANVTRLDCVLGTAAMKRQALVQAIHHARHRMAFGGHLYDQPLMRNVLADLALESEAATTLAIRLAQAFDTLGMLSTSSASVAPGASGHGTGGSPANAESEAAFLRVMTPAAKFWICKRGPQFAAEAMEVLGGNGYVEEGPMARLYREMPVNSIWEGSGNIMCLDVLRALSKAGQASDALLHELESARGRNDDYDAAFERIATLISVGAHNEAYARRLTQLLVLAVQASLLLKAESCMAEAFCKTRLAADHGSAFGLLPNGIDLKRLIDRAWPGM